tara:strand:- start:764 stop:1933 length:1170 start_codon:yes stop_codon:yes gene_type:complete
MKKLLKVAALITPLFFLSGCSLTVPLIVFSGNGEDPLRGTATGRLSGKGDIQFKGTKTDVECTGTFEYERISSQGYGFGNAICSDGTSAEFRFDAATTSKGYGSGEDSEGRFFFFAYGYSDLAARKMFEQKAGSKLQVYGDELRPPSISLTRKKAYKETENLKELLNKVLAQTVRIKSGKSVGSGFLISGVKEGDSAGLVMTNNHVVGNKATVEISFNNDDATIGTVIGRLKTPDIALVSINNYPDKISPAAFCYGPLPSMGEKLFAVGNPLDMGVTVTRGIVSGVKGSGFEQMIITDASINSGNSGGPLFNYRGEVIGVATSKIGAIGIDNIAFAIPIKKAIDSLGLKVEAQEDKSQTNECGNLVKNQLGDGFNLKKTFQNFIDNKEE